MSNRLRAIKKFLFDHQFGCFIFICIAIAIIMTIISLELYRFSGAIKLDMSRPGFERVRREVEKDTDNQVFDSSGPLDNKAVKDFNGRLEKYQKQLKELGGYNNGDVGDSDLNLTDDKANQENSTAQ